MPGRHAPLQGGNAPLKCPPEGGQMLDLEANSIILSDLLNFFGLRFALSAISTLFYIHFSPFLRFVEKIMRKDVQKKVQSSQQKKLN